jgi:hypothetical protein
MVGGVVMRIVYENKFTELDDSQQAEKKRMEFRVSVGGFGVERESVIKMLADISDKVLELALRDEETEIDEVTAEQVKEDMQIDSIHNKFEDERKGWFR